MKKVKDFGKKIEGAKKFRYKKSDIEKMSENEKVTLIQRDKIFPSVNGKKQVEKGIQPCVALWQQKTRQYIKKTPCKKDDETLETYTDLVSKAKDMILSAKTIEDSKNVQKLFQEIYSPSTQIAYSRGLTVYNAEDYKSHVERTNWPYNNRNSAARRKRKEKYVPPQLKHIHRTGVDYLCGHRATQELWMEHMKPRGVQFGNWLDDRDRIANMDMAYVSMLDLSQVLDCKPHEAFFNSLYPEFPLGLAFGARGVPYAAAHYEFSQNVINLTKMSGAGSLAHEWFHALDGALAVYLDLVTTRSHLASTSSKLYLRARKNPIANALYELRRWMHNGKTIYHKDSVAWDCQYTRMGGYWSSVEEMLARAFGVYIEDKLEALGIQNDYLTGHARLSAPIIIKGNDNDTLAFNFPANAAEMAEITGLFDNLFEELRKAKFFSCFPETKCFTSLEEEIKPINIKNRKLFEAPNGQLSFF